MMDSKRFAGTVRLVGLSWLAGVSWLPLTQAAQAQSAIPPGPAARAPAASVAPAANETALDAISVTSTKTEERAVDTLGGASVLTRDNFDAIRPDRVSDILRQVPGVTTQERHNDPGQAINIRGLQDFGRVNVLVDGARQNFQSTGHGASGTFYLDPELIGGVDITRGPVATIYGSGAIGGVVSFRTLGIDDILKRDEQAGVVQRIGGGTNGYGIVNSTSVGVRLPNNAANVFGQFVYRQNYVYQDGAGILVPDTGSQLTAGNFKVNVNPTDDQKLSFTALLQKFDFANNGTSGTGARFRSNLDTQTYTLGYRYTPADMPLIDLSIKGYYSTTNDLRTFLQDSAGNTYTALGARPGNPITVDLKTYGFDVFNTSRFDTGPVSHALTYGGDGAFDKVRTTDFAGGYTAAFTPTGKRDLTGAFVQDELRFGGWLRAVGAVRYDSYELSGGNNDFRLSGDRVSPRGTLGVSPLPWIEFYATYAEAYRAPAISETLISGTHPFPAFQILPNTSLRPETAHNVEGGINLKFDNLLTDGDAVRAKVTAFSNTVDNFINIQGVGPTFYVNAIAGANPALCAGRTAPFVNGRAGAICVIGIQAQQYVNIAQAQLNGVEFEGAYDWGWGFASAAFSHTDGRNASSNVALVSVPPDKLSGTLAFRLLDRHLTIGTRVIYADARKNFPVNSLIVNTRQFGLVDLFASYDYNDWIRGDVTLSNIFDRRYIQYLDLDRSPGFQARGGLTIKFATR